MKIKCPVLSRLAMIIAPLPSYCMSKVYTQSDRVNFQGDGLGCRSPRATIIPGES